MAAPSITNTFTSNTTALASEMNTNFDDILAGLSGGSTWDVVVSTLTATTVAANISKAAAVTITSTGAGVAVTTDSNAGDDFTVNSTALVVEGDTGSIGIGASAFAGVKTYIESSLSRCLYMVTTQTSGTSSTGTLEIDTSSITSNVSASSALRVATIAGNTLIVSNNGNVYMPAIVSGAGTYALKWTTSTGELTYDTSSARYKDNIRDSQYGLSTVMSLVSRQFEYKDTGISDVGFVAEEVVNVIPELVPIDSEGRPDAVNYDRITSVLVKAIQELKAIVDAQAVEIAALKAK